MPSTIYISAGPSYIELSINPIVNNMSCPTSLHAVDISCLVPFTDLGHSFFYTEMEIPRHLTMAIGAGGAIHPRQTLSSERGFTSQLSACLPHKSYITCYAWNGIQHYGPVIKSTLFLVTGW